MRIPMTNDKILIDDGGCRHIIQVTEITDRRVVGLIYTGPFRQQTRRVTPLLDCVVWPRSIDYLVADVVRRDTYRIAVTKNNGSGYEVRVYDRNDPGHKEVLATFSLDCDFSRVVMCTLEPALMNEVQSVKGASYVREVNVDRV